MTADSTIYGRRYCEESLRCVFSGGAREVIFDAQIGYVRKRPR